MNTRVTLHRLRCIVIPVFNLFLDRVARVFDVDPNRRLSMSEDSVLLLYNKLKMVQSRRMTASKIDISDVLREQNKISYYCNGCYVAYFSLDERRVVTFCLG